MAAYQLTLTVAVIREADHVSILPNDPNDNGAWAQYQAWLAAGNVPDPAPVLSTFRATVPPVAVPNNAAAKAAGVPVGGQYSGAGDPAIVYIRTA